MCVTGILQLFLTTELYLSRAGKMLDFFNSWIIYVFFLSEIK